MPNKSKPESDASRTALDFRFHHGGVSVPDLEASIAWYRDVLDFELETQFPIDQIPAKVAFMRKGELRFELFEVPGAAPASKDRGSPNLDLRTHGNKHLAFAVSDVHALAAELKSRGADVVVVNDFEFGSNAFIRDNSGNLIEFLEANEP
jgi:catechol 2,3-dioxygenase-like lactoylglutathione lyase family enzyme